MRALLIAVAMMTAAGTAQAQTWSLPHTDEAEVTIGCKGKKPCVALATNNRTFFFYPATKPNYLDLDYNRRVRDGLGTIPDPWNWYGMGELRRYLDRNINRTYYFVDMVQHPDLPKDQRPYEGLLCLGATPAKGQRPVWDTCLYVREAREERVEGID